jgi:hypothetical protein
MRTFAAFEHGEESGEVAMSMSEPRDTDVRRREEGFALILAILSLMLLTFLGLTLATTTSTELQIATNYRWSAQALYNAEAGVEMGKRILQDLEWSTVLPNPRSVPWVPPTGTPAAADRPVPRVAGATRDLENGDCDSRGNGAGYGVVLYDGVRFWENMPDTPGFGAERLNGAFTLWVRRPVIADAAAGQYKDNDATSDVLVLTAEGVAPYVGPEAGTFSRVNGARRVIEVTVERVAGANPCSQRAGQVGGGPEGNNAFGGPCGGLDPATALGNYPTSATFITGAGTLLP